MCGDPFMQTFCQHKTLCIVHKLFLVVVSYNIILFSRFVDNKVGTDGTGALLTLRHPITLKGSNIFQGNMGGALSLFQARMDVSGQVLFENNTALNGGGMLMFDQSIVCQVAIEPLSLAIPHPL